MANIQPAYKILTWGCQMNEDDSLQMANLLEQMGYRQTNDESDADVILLNTCSVREKPEQKVLSKLGELRTLKEENRDLIIAVCGCMAQREGEKLLKRVPAIDIIVGTASIPELPMLVEQARNNRARSVAIEFPENEKSNGSTNPKRLVGNVGLKAFVPAMYGCNNYCAYCVVPSARGPERSRTPEDILKEISELVALGTREVTLVGQNVNSYNGQSGDRPIDFAELLAKANEVEGLERIRFVTSHPKDLSEKLIDAMAELPKVCEHLHLPIQSGDNKILKRMGRGYTVEQYLSLAETVRERIPGISLTTDVMVGFPGETDDQYQNTLVALREVGYDAAFMFAFNPRPGTMAAKMNDQIEHSVKTLRLIEMISVQNEITLKKNEKDIGKVFEVLTEGQSQKDGARMTGYTRTNKTVNFIGCADKGSVVKVRADEAHLWGFSGEMI